MGGPTRAPRGAVTMHEVAARARVSVKTVSNVVNDYPHVRPATRERVERAIRDLGYQVNVSARSLRRGRTGVIGLALPELSLPYFAELADSFMAEAEKRDHRRLGSELDLFSFPDEIGSGFPVFHPNGATIRMEMEEHSRS